MECPGEHQEVKMAWQVGQIERLYLTRVADFLFRQDTFAEELFIQWLFKMSIDGVI